MKKFLALILLTTLLPFSGCTKSSSDDDGSDRADGDSGGFRTNCGVVSEGSLQNPISVADGIRGRARVAGPNLLIFSLPSGDVLVKLHSIDEPSRDFMDTAARNVLTNLTQEEAIYFPAESDCTTTVEGGGTGALGQFFTASGVNYSERLITSGFAQVDADPCGGEELSSCYDALIEESGSQVAGEVGRFLWKPVSDSNGKLAIHTAPSGTSVRVAGETGTNQGGGNGYGSLARFGKPGCGYGGNVVVEVFNAEGLPYLFNGERSLTIPSGCNRWCYENGTLVQCVKQ